VQGWRCNRARINSDVCKSLSWRYVRPGWMLAMDKSLQCSNGKIEELFSVMSRVSQFKKMPDYSGGIQVLVESRNAS
jgi:hypothetical protein